MFKWFYNFGLILLLLIALPRLFQRKYRRTLKSRLGFNLPRLSSKKNQVIWIHAISMGETRAIIPLFHKLRASQPQANILISTTTETGLAEAKKNMPQADAYFLLPFDLSCIIGRAVKAYQPDLLVLVESDFWFNLLDQVKKRGGRVMVVNAKISERSYHRFQKVPFFAKKLFGQIDHFCVQNTTYQEHFISLGVAPAACTVTGNIKLDFLPKILTPEEKKQFQEELGLQPRDQVIVIGSTHPQEEDLLLNALQPFPHLKIVLVPRHPERFKEVEELLRMRGESFMIYSQRSTKTGNERIILIDAMGLLNKCYQLATVAIVGGSFIEKIGGHNILEPTFVGIPVLFGPHMFSQKDLVNLVLTGLAGFQVTLQKLSETLKNLLDSPAEYQSIAQNAMALSKTIRGATDRTLQVIELQGFRS